MRVSKTSPLWLSARLERAIYIADGESDEEDPGFGAQRRCASCIRGRMDSCTRVTRGRNTCGFEDGPPARRRGTQAMRAVHPSAVAAPGTAGAPPPARATPAAAAGASSSGAAPPGLLDRSRQMPPAPGCPPSSGAAPAPSSGAVPPAGPFTPRTPDRPRSRSPRRRGP